MNEDRLLTRKDLQERWGISKSQFEKLKNRGDLPEHVVISERVHRWRESVVKAWEDERDQC